MVAQHAWTALVARKYLHKETKTSDLGPHLVRTEAHHEHQVRLDCIEHTVEGQDTEA